MRPVVALAMPSRYAQGIDGDALARGIVGKATFGDLDIAPGCAWTSLLPYTFNLLWCGFLDRRAELKLTHFAMIHDDIRPDPGWLDLMVAELESTGADLISAVVPIKDGRGLTSTAVDDVTGDIWNPRRLMLAEVHGLPPTFTDEDVGGPLLVNTGLWVCRFNEPWCEDVCFQQQDSIVREPGGKFVPHTIPEDWDFSRQVRSKGGVIVATRKVGLEHERAEWHNRRPWGTWATDMDLAASDRSVLVARPPLRHAGAKT